MSNEKNLGWLGYIGDYTTQLYGDYNKPDAFPLFAILHSSFSVAGRDVTFRLKTGEWQPFKWWAGAKSNMAGCEGLVGQGILVPIDLYRRWITLRHGADDWSIVSLKEPQLLLETGRSLDHVQVKNHEFKFFQRVTRGCLPRSQVDATHGLLPPICCLAWAAYAYNETNVFFFVVVSKVPMFFGVFWDTTTVAENFTINGFAVDQVLDFVSIIFGGWKWSYFVAQLPATVWNSCHFLLERLP